MAQAAFCLWGLPAVDLLASSHTTQSQHYYTLEIPLPLRALGLNAFNHPWMFQVSYVFPPPVLVPPSSVQVSGRTCQRSTQTFDSGGTMLDGGSLASHSSQHVGRCSSVLSHHKRSHHGCFGRPCAQESAISAFNPFTAQRCVLCRHGFSSSVCQAVAGATRASTSKVYQQCWKEWAGWCAQEGVQNNAISAPKLADFWFIYLGLACPGLQLVFIILLFLLF